MAQFFDTNSNDNIIGTDSNDIIQIAGGNDIINGKSGYDILLANYGTSGNEVDLNLRPEGNYTEIDVFFSDGNSILSAAYNIEEFQVISSSANDYLYLRYNDKFNYQFDGNQGFDILSLDFSDNNTKITSSLTGNKSGEYTYGNKKIQFKNIEVVEIIGSNNDDVLVALTYNNQAGVRSWIDGNNGFDTLAADYSSSDKHITSVNVEKVTQGDYTEGSINVIFNDGSSSAIDFYGIEAFQLVGTENNDRINWEEYNFNLIFSAGAGSDIITGGNKNDKLSGGAGIDQLWGGNGNDQLFGEQDSDILLGEGNNDTLRGGAGNDSLSGGVGKDVLIGDSGSDILLGDTDNDTLKGGGGNDTLNGGKGNDRLIAGYGNDVLHGDEGNDYLTGNNGNDSLYGGEGNDRLIGGKHNDFLVGGDGIDTLFGGQDKDTFVIQKVTRNNRDVIADYIDGVDILGLSDGLTFGNLAIANNSDNTATVIRDNNNNVLAILSGINSSVISQGDFTTI